MSGDVIPLDPILRSLGMPTRTRSLAGACAWLEENVADMQTERDGTNG